MPLEDLAALKIDHAHRASSGRRATWIGLVLVVVVLATAAWFWATRVDAVQVRVATVTAASGGPAAGGAVLNASGYVTARRRATVSSKVTGKVMEVFVEEGKSVRAGQVLARLDDSQTRAALAMAEAQLGAARKGFAEDQARLREARLNLDRRERLLSEQVVGKAEVDTARSEVDALEARIAYAQQQISVAESQVNLRRTDLDDMIVRAPFSGVAISKDAQPGEMVSPVSAGGGFTRTGICTIVDMSSLEIEVDVNESYINRVKPAQKVEAVLDAYPDWRIPAHVITTVPTADRQKATVRVRIGFNPSTSSGQAPSTGSGQAPSTGSGRASSTSSGLGDATQSFDPRILPDMGVKVSFLREDEPVDAAAPRVRMLAPKTAIRQQDGKAVVFVVREDRVERRAIQVGAENGDQVEVLSGLSSGDRIVVDAPATLKDGDRIRIS